MASNTRGLGAVHCIPRSGERNILLYITATPSQWVNDIHRLKPASLSSTHRPADVSRGRGSPVPAAIQVQVAKLREDSNLNSVLDGNSFSLGHRYVGINGLSKSSFYLHLRLI